MNVFNRAVSRAVFAGVVLACAGNASANLISPNVVLDNPLHFQGTVDVTVFSVDSYTFTSSNWFVNVREDFIGSEAQPNDFEVTARHLVAITPGEAAPNPLSMSIIFFANSFTPGGPARGPFPTFTIHAPDALDFLTVSYTPVVAGQSSRITITADHGANAVAVPEPATFGTIAVGLIAAARRRRALLRRP
jgi:hypothetical protein